MRPKHFLCNLDEVLKASTENYPVGYESSIFVSKNLKISALPLISSEWISNLFQIAFIFKWEKLILLAFSFFNTFRLYPKNFSFKEEFNIWLAFIRNIFIYWCSAKLINSRFLIVKYFNLIYEDQKLSCSSVIWTITNIGMVVRIKMFSGAYFFLITVFYNRLIGPFAISW